MSDKQHKPQLIGDKEILKAPVDFTKLGGYKKSTKRPADKENSEPRDSRHDDFTEFSHKDDDEKHRQPLFKGDGYQGSATSDEWLDKDYIKNMLKTDLKEGFDLSEMQSLLESNSDDKEFVTNCLDIFNATLQSKYEELQEAALETTINVISEYAEQLNESYEEELAALEEGVSEYLDAVVLEWAHDNKLAIQESAQTSIAQSFMNDLAALLEAYNIDVSEDKMDLYESAVEAGEKLYADYEDLQEAYNELLDDHLQIIKESAVEEFLANTDLTLSESEKIRKLAANLDYESYDSFIDKLSMLGESYINMSNQRKNPYVNIDMMEDFYVDEDDGIIVESENVADDVVEILNHPMFQK